MSFWAVEIAPNKEHTTTPQFDLRVSAAVLPANATDKSRSLVQVKLEEQPFVLASLKLDLQENVNLDLIFEAGKEVSFSVVGKNPVQLIGYFIDVDTGIGGELDDDEDDIDSDDEIFDEDDEGDDDDDEEVDEEELAKTIQALTNNKRKVEQPQANGAKKAKVEQPQVQKGEQKPQTPKAEQQPKGAQTPKGEQAPKGQQQPKGAQTPKGEQASKGQQQPKAQQKPQTPPAKAEPQQKATKLVLKNGLTVETIKAGAGATATSGKKVRVHYTGRLTNGKIFDKSRGAPFEFRLGAGEVIAGWDHGVAGMKVGEKRKLTIPPQLAYGARGAPPDIPKNATLEFDVELVSA